eukprot:750368-Rhodomonas_salina.2
MEAVSQQRYAGGVRELVSTEQRQLMEVGSADVALVQHCATTDSLVCGEARVLFCDIRLLTVCLDRHDGRRNSSSELSLAGRWKPGGSRESERDNAPASCSSRLFLGENMPGPGSLNLSQTSCLGGAV